MVCGLWPGYHRPQTTDPNPPPKTYICPPYNNQTMDEELLSEQLEESKMLMEEAITHLESELMKIRTGKASTLGTRR